MIEGIVVEKDGPGWWISRNVLNRHMDYEFKGFMQRIVEK